MSQAPYNPAKLAKEKRLSSRLRANLARRKETMRALNQDGEDIKSTISTRLRAIGKSPLLPTNTTNNEAER